MPESSQRLGSWFNVQKLAVPGCGMFPWHRSLALILCQTIIRMTGSHLEVHLQVQLTQERKGAVGDDVSDVLQSSSLSLSYLFIVKFGTLP